jgi:tellurite resistance protein
MTDAYAPMVPSPPADPTTLALSALIPALAEEAIFAAGAAPGATRDAVEGMLKRRADVHLALLAGTAKEPRLFESFDGWMVSLARAIAPVAPPTWLPMADVLKHKVTLEAGARGLRSLFSSKPSDKDVQRVKRLGSLAVRGLRAVLSADGLIDPDERRMIAALIASLGLPEADAQPLMDEDPVSVERLDIYGDLDVDVAKAILAGAWFAAASDGLDPREEQVVRSLAFKLGRTTQEVEEARGVANEKVERGRLFGLAAVEVMRVLLADRIPGPAAELTFGIGKLVTPRRYQAEVLAPGANVATGIGKRYAKLELADRGAVLAMAWAAALYEDPPLSRKAALRARFDRLAVEMGEEGGKVRSAVEGPIDETIATLASGMR